MLGSRDLRETLAFLTKIDVRVRQPNMLEQKDESSRQGFETCFLQDFRT